MPDENFAFQALDVHRLSWSDLDQIARGGGGAGAVRRLRSAERSRRLLLMRALVDEITKAPELSGPLPSPELAWELLARVQDKSPAVLEMMLGHPYTGSWVGYTMRLLRNHITGVGPTWGHVGHLHALAAAAAVRAKLDFQTLVPLWYGCAALPTLGVACLGGASPWSVARVQAEDGVVTVTDESRGTVTLPADPSSDGPGWWGVRPLTASCGRRTLSVRLDDLDPYRGLYEPVQPQRLDESEMEAWRSLFDGAWYLLCRCLPGLCDAVAAGLDSIVPQPAVPFRQPSASTGEAFGSAVVGLPADSASLAATIVHEFQHIRLGGVLHLVPMHKDDDRERFYTGWRDDPRPIAGALQGVYAYVGVTAFWRALARSGKGPTRTAQFEFAHWRGETWRTLCALRDDPVLTPTGQRFMNGLAEVMRAWQDEPVPTDLARDATAVAADHYAGWRVRFLRPDPAIVETLATAWVAGRPRVAALAPPRDCSPTPVPDGPWSRVRAHLIRMRIADPQSLIGDSWRAVPGVTAADHAYASGRFDLATQVYQAQLETDPDQPELWTGLGLALAAQGTGPAGRALLHFPEVVRAVHRRLRMTAAAPQPRELADWIGRSTR